MTENEWESAIIIMWNKKRLQSLIRKNRDKIKSYWPFYTEIMKTECME